MGSDELVPTTLVGRGGTHTTGIEYKINQETVNWDPSEAQTESNDPESDKLLIDVLSSLTLETMLPRILSSVRMATYLPENKQEESRKISAI